jgi:hypothetical protein
MSRSLGGKIRVCIKRRWRGYPVGAVIKPPGALRKMLLQDGTAEVMPEEAAAVEQAEEAVESTEQMNLDAPHAAETSDASFPDEEEKPEATEKKKRKRKADAGDE